MDMLGVLEDALELLYFEVSQSDIVLLLFLQEHGLSYLEMLGIHLSFHLAHQVRMLLIFEPPVLCQHPGVLLVFADLISHLLKLILSN